MMSWKMLKPWRFERLRLSWFYSLSLHEVVLSSNEDAKCRHIFCPLLPSCEKVVYTEFVKHLGWLDLCWRRRSKQGNNPHLDLNGAAIEFAVQIYIVKATSPWLYRHMVRWGHRYLANVLGWTTMTCVETNWNNFTYYIILHTLLLDRYFFCR